MIVYSKLKTETIVSKKPKLGICDPIEGTCYELGHTWTSSCLQSYRDIFRDAFIFSIKVYGSLYLFGFVLNWKKNREIGFKKSFSKLARDVLQSTIFLAMNAAYFVSTFCVFKKIFRRYYGFFGLTIGAVSGFLSIILERKKRRQMLGLYLLNLGFETLFRMAVDRGLLSPVKHGEMFLFSVVSGMYMSLFRTSGLPKSIQSNIEKIIGTAAVESNQHTNPRILRWSEMWSNILKYALRNFGIGYLIELALNLKSIISVLMGKSNSPLHKFLTRMNIAKFLGTYTFLFNTVNYLFKFYFVEDHPALFGAAAGLVAGLSSMFYSSTSVTLYLLFKMLEILFTKGVECNMLPRVPHTDILFYCFGFGILGHAAVFEPHNIRPGYWEFLVQLTGGKFPLMFRKVLDRYGTNASRMYPNFVPDLDPKFVTAEGVRRMLAMYEKYPKWVLK